MKFINTKRFSPVASGKDLPRGNDLYYKDPLEVSGLNQKDLIRFCIEHKIVIDEEWWKRQLYRCLHGYTVENAIEEGGDCFIDGIDALWSENDCFIPEYDLVIKDRTVHISGRMYFLFKLLGDQGNRRRREQEDFNSSQISYDGLFSFIVGER